MKSTRLGLLPLLLTAYLGAGRLMSAPQLNPEQNLARAIADSSWNGAMGDVAKGSSPADLKIVLQKGKLTGFPTYAGFEETLSVTVSAPSAFAKKGDSVRDLQGARRGFDLETSNAELSQDGRRLSGTTETRSRFKFRSIR